MKELIIKNQIEFDNISNDFSGCIYFEKRQQFDYC